MWGSGRNAGDGRCLKPSVQRTVPVFLSAAVRQRAIAASKLSRKFLEVALISGRLVAGQYLKVSLFQGKLVRSITLFLLTALVATSAHAASYEKIDDTIDAMLEHKKAKISVVRVPVAVRLRGSPQR